MAGAIGFSESLGLHTATTSTIERIYTPLLGGLDCPYQLVAGSNGFVGMG